MKLWMKLALAGIVGFGGGFVAGFFSHKKMNDIQIEEITEEEMAELQRSVEVHNEKPSNSISDDQLPEDPDKVRLTLQGKKSYLEADAEAKKANLEVWNTIKRYSDEDNANELPIESMESEFDKDFLEDIKNEDVYGESVSTLPYPIDLPEFYNERNEYDKITIEWYEPDDTFIDEKEEVIGDIKAYIGDIDPKTLFSESDNINEDPDIRFVRNEQYGTDYEIVRHHRSYHEMTGGSD